MKDLANSIQIKRALSPASVSDNTASVAQIIDRQGFEGLTYAINIGSVADADATFTVLLEHGDVSNLSDAVAVPDADMISQTVGTAPEAAASFQYDSDNQVRKLGYVGGKRYTRLTITPANNASAAVYSAIAILSHPTEKPVVQASA